MNLDRFSVPLAGETRSEEPVAMCAVCEEPLYEGDEVYRIDDGYICSHFCLRSYFEDNLVTL